MTKFPISILVLFAIMAILTVFVTGASIDLLETAEDRQVLDVLGAISGIVGIINAGSGKSGQNFADMINKAKTIDDVITGMENSFRDIKNTLGDLAALTISTDLQTQIRKLENVVNPAYSAVTKKSQTPVDVNTAVKLYSDIANFLARLGGNNNVCLKEGTCAANLAALKDPQFLDCRSHSIYKKVVEMMPLVAKGIIGVAYYGQIPNIKAAKYDGKTKVNDLKSSVDKMIQSVKKVQEECASADHTAKGGVVEKVLTSLGSVKQKDRPKGVRSDISDILKERLEDVYTINGWLPKYSWYVHVFDGDKKTDMASRGFDKVLAGDSKSQKVAMMARYLIAPNKIYKDPQMKKDMIAKWIDDKVSSVKTIKTVESGKQHWVMKLLSLNQVSKNIMEELSKNPAKYFGTGALPTNLLIRVGTELDFCSAGSCTLNNICMSRPIPQPPIPIPDIAWPKAKLIYICAA
jgi:hypothetical protein